MSLVPTPVLRPTNDQFLRGKPLLLARIGWVVVTLVTVGLDFYAIPALYQLAATGCPDPGPCGVGVQFLTVSQLAQLHAQGISSDMVATLAVVQQTVATLIFVTVAAIIFWRRSDDRMALFAAYTLVTFGGAVVGGALQVLPTTNFVWFFLITTLVIMGQMAWTAFFTLFPDGRFVPGWTRWVALIWALPWLAAYFPGVAALDFTEELRSGPFLIIGVVIALVFAQVYRYRRVSDAWQRQQTKWVVYGFALGAGLFAALLVVGNFIPNAEAGPDALGQLIVNTVFTMLFTLIPVSIGIAILRSRLYDIDIIIQRTLVYGSLTLVLVAIYVVGVVGVQTLLGALTGQQTRQDPILIVATTLLIAALFQPLRRNIQAFIDRRFYRTKYSAEKTLSAFSAALRSEVDLGHLSTHLVEVVEETMRPEHVSLWLKPTMYLGIPAPSREDQGGGA